MTKCKTILDFRPKLPVLLPPGSDLARTSTRTKPHKARVKAPTEALVQDSHFHWRKRPVYKTGDGDDRYFYREGSDHSHLKTFGDPT